ncbi:MAG TPA: GGDEF domain-containing protein [Treponemataceae bacterium]|nr:GGDEF domain-containing protein [Treponemataceae bacterium]
MATDGDNEGKKRPPQGDSVGVLIDSVSGFFNRRAIACLIDAADERGLHLVFYFGGYIERGRECGASSYAYTLPDPETLDALIVFPHNISPYSPESVFQTILTRCKDLPIYSFFGDLPSTFSVIANEDPAIKELARHIAETHAYRKVSILSGPDSPESLSRYRRDRIVELLGERGITVAPEAIADGDFTMESGRQAARKLLSDGQTIPDVLVCLNDEMAIGAAREFLNKGISVPEDIAITGFDDVEEGSSLAARLSSVSFPIWEMTAALLDRVASDLSGTTTYESEKIRFNASFVIRESCGCTSRMAQAHATLQSTESREPQPIKAQWGETRKINALRRNLEDILEKSIATRDPAQFMAFIQRAIRELTHTGDLDASFIDLFTTQWTISALRHKEFNSQIFINALFVDAFRLLLQSKTQVFARLHESDLGTINFTQICNNLIAQHFSVQETVAIIAANLPLLGIERCLMVFLSATDPNLGELRLAYREGKSPEIPESDFPVFPAHLLIPEGVEPFKMPTAILPLVHANTVYGYMVFSMTSNRYEHFCRLQALVSQIIDAAMSNDMIENRIRTLTRTNDALSKLSVIDEFTGLFNRRALYTTGRTMYEQTVKSGEPCSFIFLDMDGLKKINDTFGHKEGDDAILALSRILKRCFRENDLVVRYGGDEFVVLMSNIHEAALQGTFKRIAEQITAFNAHGAHPWTLSASWGFVFVEPSPDEARTFESIIEESDAKLYEVKRKKKEAAKGSAL